MNHLADLIVYLVLHFEGEDSSTMKSSLLCVCLAVFCISYAGQFVSVQADAVLPNVPSLPVPLPANLPNLDALGAGQLIDLLISLITSVLNILQPTVAQLTGPIAALVPTLSAALAQLLAAVVDVIKQVKALKGGLLGIVGGLLDTVGQLLASLLAPLAAVPAVGPLLSPVTSTLLKTFNDAKGLTGALLDSVNQLTDQVLAIIPKVLGPIVAILCNAVVGLVENVASGVQLPLAGDVVQELTQKLNLSKQVCGSLGTALSALG